MGAFLSGYCYYVLLRAIPIDLFFFSSFLGALRRLALISSHGFLFSVACE